MIFSQVFDMIDSGLLIVDKDLNVTHWNRWMASKSGISHSTLLGSPLLASFPNLNNANFRRSCKTVLNFGNAVFFEQAYYRFLFPFPPVSHFGYNFEFMQQDCMMGPIRDENGRISHLFISVKDVTRAAAYEEQLIESSRRDALTGLYNRRYLDEKLMNEVDRHTRYARPFSLLLFDVDFFKKINDTYGHQCGDYILQEIARKVADRIRSTDMVARYGGEEFCCLLPETPIASGVILAERLRKMIEAEDFVFEGETIKVSVSIGASTISLGINTPEILLQKADEALYRAKENGRNRVERMA